MDAFSTELSPTSVYRSAASLHADDRYSVELAPPTLWRRLLDGHLLIVSTETRERSVLLSLRARSLHERPTALSRGARSAFEAAVRGKLQKVVAYEHGSSASTVAGKLRQVLTHVGLDCNFSRLPLAAVLLAHAALHPGVVECSWEERGGAPGGATLLRVMLRRCDDELRPHLSKSELAVARYLLEGDSHETIAQRRATSVRTIANQISSIYRKTGASGRFELVRALVESPDQLGKPLGDGARYWRKQALHEAEGMPQGFTTALP